jgi:hypothetical protein
MARRYRAKRPARNSKKHGASCTLGGVYSLLQQLKGAQNALSVHLGVDLWVFY